MPTPEAAQLSEVIRLNMEEVKKLCAGLDEKTASSAPAGRWSPKQIVSHLCGPEGAGHLPLVRTFLEKDTPRVDINPGDPFFSEKRSRMTMPELLTEFEQEYKRLSDFAAGLSAEQLNRKAHIPALKESPLGEYLTLATWINVLGERHVTSHIDHLREILKELGVVAPA